MADQYISPTQKAKAYRRSLLDQRQSLDLDPTEVAAARALSLIGAEDLETVYDADREANLSGDGDYSADDSGY
jgi:hypothetical protein